MPAAPPSETCEALPAVIVPSSPKAGCSAARRSSDVSVRIPSSWASSGSGTISSASRPSAVAAAARSWERSASMSCAARVTSRRTFSASDSSPIPTPPIEQYRPSWTMRSRIGSSGERCTACGARLMESKPPTSTQSASPSRTMPAASATDVMLARQTSLIVVPGVARATPPRIAAWRAGFWPFAACRTLPRRMWSGTRPGQRSSVSRTACAPRSMGSTSASARP